MLYQGIRQTSLTKDDPSNSSSNDYNSDLPLRLMPRYHYSRTASGSATPRSESFFPRHYLNTQLSMPTVTGMTMSNTDANINDDDQDFYGPLKSPFIPFTTNHSTLPSEKRDSIEIPITREDGTSTTNNFIRQIPIQFITEPSSLPNNTDNNNSEDSNPVPRYTSLFRPSSRYSQHHSYNDNEESAGDLLRLPSVARRLSLSIPVMTATTSTMATVDDDTVKQNPPSSPMRSIPVRLSQPPNVTSPPTNRSRISSAIVRSSPLLNNPLPRQKNDFMDTSLTSDFTTVPINTISPRRNEVMAREAIQGIARFQQQQQRPRTGSISDTNNDKTVRSPVLSRRVIVNLKNNQSVSLDSRISSANPLSIKPSPMSPSSSITQKNNLYHIPVLHEIQMPSRLAPTIPEPFLLPSRSLSIGNRNNNNNSYKNEFRMEIPVILMSNNDQENRIEQNHGRRNGSVDYNQQMRTVTECAPSAITNRNQSLKSILKRSSSRETFSRKNVSFVNA